MIRVFPSRTQWTPTDDMAFVGEPPLFRPPDRHIPVRVSVTFTWHKPEAERIPLRKRRCYTMIGYDSESLTDAERRIERVFDLGFMPFCQLYRPDEGTKDYPPEWRAVRRKWSRPAAYMRPIVK